jgi:hypothetical protein
MLIKIIVILAAIAVAYGNLQSHPEKGEKSSK